MTIILNNPVQ